MALGVMFFIVAVAVIAIWIIIEAKRMKHKIFAIVIIALILFTYISFTVVLKNTDTDLKTVNGLVSAGKLYVVWLGNVFKNMKSVTTYASKQDWKNISKTDNSTSNLQENQTNSGSTNSTNSNSTMDNSSIESSTNIPENSSKVNKTDPLQSIWDKL